MSVAVISDRRSSPLNLDNSTALRLASCDGQPPRSSGENELGLEGEIRMTTQRSACLNSFAVFGLVALFFAQPAATASIEEIALLKSADRQKILVEGAKKEGKIMWYTTLIVDQVVRPVKEAFEKEYPFIQIDFYRGNAENLVRRMLAEYQAKRYDVDLIDGTVSPVMVQRATSKQYPTGLLQRFYSPYLTEYHAELKDAQGCCGYTNLYIVTPGHNTSMVKRN